MHISTSRKHTPSATTATMIPMIAYIPKIEDDVGAVVEVGLAVEVGGAVVLGGVVLGSNTVGLEGKGKKQILNK